MYVLEKHKKYWSELHHFNGWQSESCYLLQSESIILIRVSAITNIFRHYEETPEMMLSIIIAISEIILNELPWVLITNIITNIYLRSTIVTSRHNRYMSNMLYVKRIWTC